jgi:hypothetical protein
MYRWNQLRTCVVREGTGLAGKPITCRASSKAGGVPRFPFSSLTLLQKYSRTFHGAEEYSGDTLCARCLCGKARVHSRSLKSLLMECQSELSGRSLQTLEWSPALAWRQLPNVTFGLPVIRQESTSKSRDAFARQYEFESAFEEIFLQVSCTRGPLM